MLSTAVQYDSLSKVELYRLSAENYLKVNNLEHEIRFDVISIIHNNNKTEIEHFISAF